MSEILRTIFFVGTNPTPTDNIAVLIFVAGIFREAKSKLKILSQHSSQIREYGICKFIFSNYL